LQKVILKEKDLKFYLELIKKAGKVSLDTETTGSDPVTAKLVGMSLSLEPEKGIYIPLRHNYSKCPKQMPIEKFCAAVRPVLESVKVAGHNIQYDYIILKQEGIILKNIADDTKILAYLIAPNEHNSRLTFLADLYLGKVKKTFKELVGTGRKVVTIDTMPIEEVAPYAIADAKLVTELIPILHKKLDSLGMIWLYENIEIPLISILGDMQLTGIKIDCKILKAISHYLECSIEKISIEILKFLHKKKDEFNINSPKQLAQALFNDLALEPIKRTKGGALATDIDVLEALKNKHPVIPLLIDYRHLSKIKNTYTDTLPELINPATGRLHTSFSQTTAATGRLASSDPNLQNIPVKDKLGKDIRRAFIPNKGCVFLVADYSQIELRLLAHLSNDPVMIDIYKHGGDIHKETADAVFPNIKDREKARYDAKPINFSINYGISIRSLAQELGVNESKAKEFIWKYFNKYKGVKEYMCDIVKETRELGYSATILGRKRPIPELDSSRKAIYFFGKRIALNNPVQGSAADIIKIAMIQIAEALKEKRIKTKMLLQVHDELIFEVPKNEIKQAKKVIKLNMEHLNRYKAFLKCPLKVSMVADIGVGKNWADAKE